MLVGIYGGGNTKWYILGSMVFFSYPRKNTVLTRNTDALKGGQLQKIQIPTLPYRL